MAVVGVMLLLPALVACGSQVDVAASGTLIGRIDESDLGAGEAASATFDLAPGKYVLICNLADHYEGGMYASFEVAEGDAPESATVSVRLGEWFVSADSPPAVAGPITFQVTNRGDFDHDFVVVKTDLAPPALVLK